MEIQTVKESEGGYIINGTISVPNASGNRNYKAVQEWIAEGNTPEPEFTPDQVKNKKRNKARTSLDSQLKQMVYVISPGKVLQIRPQDYLNITLALEYLKLTGEPSVDFVMADNTVSPVTAAELSAALRDTVVLGKGLWQEYTNFIKRL